MQDLANKNQDSGRCPICGKVTMKTVVETILLLTTFFITGLSVEALEPCVQRS